MKDTRPKRKHWYPSKSFVARKFYSHWQRPNHLHSKVFPLRIRFPNRCPANPKGTVLDIETTGLEPHDSHIVSIGYTFNSEVVVWILKDKNCPNWFKGFCCGLVEGLPKPIIAYSAQFERKFLWRPIQPLTYGEWRDWKDIMQYGVGESYYGPEPYYYRKKLMDVEMGPLDDIDGTQVPDEWRIFCDDGDPEHLFEIAYHNIADVIRETYVAVEDGL